MPATTAEVLGIGSTVQCVIIIHSTVLTNRDTFHMLEATFHRHSFFLCFSMGRAVVLPGRVIIIITYQD